MIPHFTYIRPQTLQEAISQLSSPEAKLHAGGTDLLSCLRDQVFGARKVVSISGLQNLRGIRESGEGGLRIGAMTTISEVAGSSLVQQRYGALARAAAEVASPQLRHQGTIGGNLCQKPRCWYYRGEFNCLRKGGRICYAKGGENQFHCIFGGKGCYIVHPSDTAPALTALGATIRIAGPGGERLVPVAAFYVGPAQDLSRETVLAADEIVTEILLPKAPPGLRSSYRKVRARQAWDFALAGVALALQFRGDTVSKAAVVLSGAAPVPWRLAEVEKIISGSRLDETTIVRAAAAAVKDAEPMEKNGYKVPLFQGMLEEELSAIKRA